MAKHLSPHLLQPMEIYCLMAERILVIAKQHPESRSFYSTDLVKLDTECWVTRRTLRLEHPELGVIQ